MIFTGMLCCCPCSGGVPTEDLIQASIDANLYICKANYTVAPISWGPLTDTTCWWMPMQTLVTNGLLDSPTRVQLLQEWSIYNYQPQANENPAAHFFATFGKFSAAKVRVHFFTCSNFSSAFLHIHHPALAAQAAVCRCMRST